MFRMGTNGRRPPILTVATMNTSYVYLEDILIFSRSLFQQENLVWQVLQRLLENTFCVKPGKCECHVPKTTFLVYVIDKGQLQMDPAMLSAVGKWLKPYSRRQLQPFLGFTNFYRRFIRNCNSNAASLTALTSSVNSCGCPSWTWTQEHSFCLCLVALMGGGVGVLIGLVGVHLEPHSFAVCMCVCVCHLVGLGI